MAPDRLARITAAGTRRRSASRCSPWPRAGRRPPRPWGSPVNGPPRRVAVLYVLPLCLFALLSTVPLAVLGAAPAAVAVTAGNTASLAAFGTATVAGIARS